MDLEKVLHYRDGYKYQLAKTYMREIPFAPMNDIITPYIKLNKAGMLALMEGYAWDGPSGPTYDSPCFMQGPLVHDAGYQLMREGYIDHVSERRTWDDIMLTIILEDIEAKFHKMNPLRMLLRARGFGWHQAVRLAASSAADPKSNKMIYTAP